jgi:hypothetical protein
MAAVVTPPGRLAYRVGFGSARLCWRLSRPDYGGSLNLKRGRNTLRCRIADKDGGHCFAWRYRIAAGESASHGRQQSCCDPGCARAAPSTTTPW